jgi:hypothetical protein
VEELHQVYVEDSLIPCELLQVLVADTHISCVRDTPSIGRGFPSSLWRNYTWYRKRIPFPLVEELHLI